MLKRVVRERKEFIFKKNHEAAEIEDFKKKKKIQKALGKGNSLPNELSLSDKQRLTHSLENDDANTINPKTHIDDEYSDYTTPHILLTTSRDPSARLMQFAKELKLVFPNAIRINRGATVIRDLAKICREKNFTDLVIVHAHKGEPDGLIISHFPYGPTAYFGLVNVTLRHDLKEKMDTMSEAKPHLIFHNFITPLGIRISNVLKHLFPVPKEDSKRIMTFSNENDFIVYRHHVYEKPDYKTVSLKEIGPRFDLKPFQILLGTIDMPDSKIEWVLRPYMTTSKKRKAL